MLNVRRVGLSPVQVPPATPLGEMLLLVDLIELARAIDRHWLPHVCDTSLDALHELVSAHENEAQFFCTLSSIFPVLLSILSIFIIKIKYKPKFK